MSGTPTLRVARPTDDLDALVPFYRDGLGLEILYRFEDHDGINGLMFGHPGSPYHFEFTRTRRRPAGRAPAQDHLLVFYLPDDVAWRAAIARMRAAGVEPVASSNPYWDRHGVTFEDPEGYRIVLQNARWSI